MITAKLRHLRISPRKVRLVTDLVKGLPVTKAERQLKFLTKKAAQPILKLLNSAVANAKNNADLVKENLYISKIVVENGPILKRWRPRAMGRAAPIMKRTSHISLILNEKPAFAKALADKSEDKKALADKSKGKLSSAKTPAVAKALADKSEDKEEKKETELLEEVQRIKEEKGPVQKPQIVPPPRPYPTTSRAKKRFFSRQTFGNVKKYFRRKSI